MCPRAEKNVKRIECENDGCTQTLRDDEVLCAECGHQQTTRGWAFVLLVVYYPIVALLVGFGVLTIGGLLFAGNLPKASLAIVGVVVGSIYVLLAGSAVRRYVRRKRRIARAPEVEPFE